MNSSFLIGPFSPALARFSAVKLFSFQGANTYTFIALHFARSSPLG